MKRIEAAARNRIGAAQHLLTAAHTLDAAGQYEKSAYERETVTNACFLNLFITMEEFFESAYGHYLTGKMSTARWRPAKYAKPTSVDHAQRMAIGFQRFMDWSTGDRVVKLAELYFKDGEPFATAIKSMTSHLNDMKTVRNGTAHTSVTTQASLDALHSRWTGTVRTGVSSYTMILATNSTTGQTFYSASETTVSNVIRQIANHS